MNIRLYKTAAGRTPVANFISQLPKADQAKFNDIYAGILEQGLDFGGAEFKHLQGKLWEIKFRSEGGGYRIAYVMVEGETMFWLHVFKKAGQKTPKGDLELALRRMKEVLS